MLGGFAFLEKGVGFTGIRAPKCPTGYPTALLLVNNSLGGAPVASRTFSRLLWTCLGKARWAALYNLATWPCGYEEGIQSQAPFITCVAVGRCLNCPMPQFPPL